MENRAALSGCPQKAPVIQNPLPKGEGLETNLSVCFADSSPNRGATGETVLAVLDERSSSFPETAGLRCRDSRLLAQHPLLERSPAAADNEDRARCFALHRTQANSRAGPACQGLPYQGSWREAPERLYHRPHFHSASRLTEGDPSYNLSVTFGDTSPGRRGLGIAQTSSFPPSGELAAQQTERVIPKNGRTSSRKCLRVSFFEENAAVPTHVGEPSFQ